VGGVSAEPGGDNDDDIVIPMRRVEELFTVDRSALLAGEARTVPGIDELVTELLGRSRVRRRARVVFLLPAHQIGPDTATTLREAVARWCRSRYGAVDRERRTLWRQGLRSLRSGSLLFIIGLLLSTDFLDPDVPEFWQNLLGNGVFLVIAWVGLWYPLDLLFFARQPLGREMRILDAVARMPVEVRPLG
jgi:hypothetical protein